MSICATCEDRGLVPFVDAANPKPDGAIGFDDLYFALCLCNYGREMRHTETFSDGEVIALWHVWAAGRDVAHDRVYGLEDVYSADELSAAGFSKPTLQMPNREAVMLAAGKKRK